jgi:hypothetical protein
MEKLELSWSYLSLGYIRLFVYGYFFDAGSYVKDNFEIK